MTFDIARKTIIFSILSFQLNSICYTQVNADDSVKLDYNKIDAYCLDGEIRMALTVTDIDTNKKISLKDLKFKNEFDNRFKFKYDNAGTDDLKIEPSFKELVKIYREYWRNSFLDKTKSFDTILVFKLASFLSKNVKPIKVTSQKDIPEMAAALRSYIELKGFKTTGFGRTGKFFDLLIWKNQYDTIYTVTLRGNERITSKVIFMDGFETLGWEEYATLGRRYPGGWTTKEAIYCVKKAYDVKSEDFTVSLIAHEGRHYADYKLFPTLSGADLEYRAKLTELSLADKTLHHLIVDFLNNANEKSANPHQAANYRLIKNLSKIIFKTDFETEVSKWHALKRKKVNRIAYRLLKRDSNKLSAEKKDGIK
jgi:hypothetical protein